MQYISQINAYWNWAKLNALPSRAGYLYFAILDCANTAGWKREFNAPNSTLQAMAGLDKNGLTRYRNILIQQGLIKYKAGDRGATGKYEIVQLYDNGIDLGIKKRNQIDTQVDTQTEPKLIPKPNPNRVHTIDKDKDKDKDKDNISPSIIPPKGIPPTLEAVREYCKERRNSVDPEKFYDFYASKGWMVGKNKMKDWKAAVRTWERSRNEIPRVSTWDNPVYEKLCLPKKLF